ncbi:MAG: arylesterase/paraoxonase [Saprospiraceae bacterium]|jgi:arylesterase/paraoxonase
MKRKYFLLLFLSLASYILYIVSSTGTFRNIENQFDGKTLAKIEIPGVEDITVDEDDHFAIFISYDRASERDGKPFKSGIYSMDLQTKEFTPKLISGSFNKPLHPHGISLIQLDSAHHRLFVVNHAEGEFIEVFDLYHRDSLVHRKTLSDSLIYSPNDIVAVSENEFYFTNDKYCSNKIGVLAENYLGLQWSETVYFDGENYRVVANESSYANGINYDKKRNLVYLAGVRDFSIKVYERKENGDLNFIEEIDCNTGVDNIELDTEGNIWVGCHPDMLTANGFIKGNKEISPSEIIRINYREKGNYIIQTVYINDGSELSASTVAAIYQGLILVGTVCDEHFLVLERD